MDDLAGDGGGVGFFGLGSAVVAGISTDTPMAASSRRMVSGLSLPVREMEVLEAI